MLEILKLTMNWGFPAFFCVLLYWDFRKKIISLDKTISNDLVHTIEEQGKIIKKDSENTEKVSMVLDKLDSSINKLIDKLTGV